MWAIQAKAYAPGYAIKKSDVDTFLSESSREVFSYRLLIATTNHIGKTALRTLEAQEKPAHLSLLGDLERASVEPRSGHPSPPHSFHTRAPGEPRETTLLQTLQARRVRAKLTI